MFYSVRFAILLRPTPSYPIVQGNIFLSLGNVKLQKKDGVLSC